MYSPLDVDMPMTTVLPVCLFFWISHDLIQILLLCTFIPVAMCLYFSNKIKTDLCGCIHVVVVCMADIRAIAEFLANSRLGSPGFLELKCRPVSLMVWAG